VIIPGWIGTLTSKISISLCLRTALAVTCNATADAETENMPKDSKPEEALA